MWKVFRSMILLQKPTADWWVLCSPDDKGFYHWKGRTHESDDFIATGKAFSLSQATNEMIRTQQAYEPKSNAGL